MPKKVLVTTLLAAAGLALAVFSCELAGHASAAVPPTAWKLESATVTLPRTFSGGTTFASVSFRQTYDAPPLVFVTASQQGPHPCTVRIRNVTTTGFEAAQVEPPGNDGPHIAMTIHYLAIDPGIHVFPDGTLVEAGSFMTTTVQHGTGVAGTEGWDTVGFNASFDTTPALLAQIQGTANETGSPPGAPSIPWLTTAVQDITTSSAELALERSEVDDGAVTSPETIAYLAIEGSAVGSFLDKGGTSVGYEAIISGPVLDGWNDGCDTVALAGSYVAAPLVMATKSTHNEDDGGWLRRCSLSTSSVGLTVDEDLDRDSERNHTNEDASILVFSQAFDAEFKHDLAVTKTVDSAAPNEGDTISYTVTVTNNGPSDATGVGLTDALPSGVTYVSDDSSGAYDPSTGMWIVGTLGAGESASLTITVTVNSDTGGATIIITTSGLTADQSDPDPTNNVGSVDITVTSRPAPTPVLTPTPSPTRTPTLSSPLSPAPTPTSSSPPAPAPMQVRTLPSDPYPTERQPSSLPASGGGPRDPSDSPTPWPLLLILSVPGMIAAWLAVRRLPHRT